ncbi:hypothetical protein LJ207_09720 [Halanaerobium sp. Z-7514]|uniref:Uncharacterized protein n=1 Tax=Halanaerobium polyolivorans TaxID=2886943 RepID=A0AAW4X1A7_9FIRM|nr:hypothetical protein [Halanaerobium polyolivorans]MCC3145601.1 hypothetical protein [Halanaerobium polyolivorans]
MTVNSQISDDKKGLTEIKGIFAGSSRETFEKSVELSQLKNIIRVEKPLKNSGFLKRR